MKDALKNATAPARDFPAPPFSEVQWQLSFGRMSCYDSCGSKISIISLSFYSWFRRTSWVRKGAGIIVLLSSYLDIAPLSPQHLAQNTSRDAESDQKPRAPERGHKVFTIPLLQTLPTPSRMTAKLASALVLTYSFLPAPLLRIAPHSHCP